MEPKTVVAPPPKDEILPQSWPGAFGLYKYAKAAVLYNWRSYMALILLYVGFTILLSIIERSVVPYNDSGTPSEYGVPYFALQVVNLVVGSALTAALIFVLLKGIGRVKTSFAEACAVMGTYVLPIFLQSLLAMLIIVASAALFIIPVFFIAPRLVLAQYFIVDKNMGPVESIRASWNATKGNVGKVYGIFGATLVMSLLMLTIIGIPFALYFLLMYSAAYPLLYVWAMRRTEVVAPAPAE
jgi:hypothetical protein